MAQQESRANVRVDPAPPRGQRRPESSPPVNQSQAPWAPLTPRAKRPPGTSSPQKAELLENQLEVMVMREKVLKAESAAAQRNISRSVAEKAYAGASDAVRGRIEVRATRGPLRV